MLTMTTPELEMVKEIPGYKVILKAILKGQIQLLVEQLALHTEEESIILTASVADGTLSHLGSVAGKQFLDNHDDIKSKFLGFCLRSHHTWESKKIVPGSQPVNSVVPSKASAKFRHEPYNITKRKRTPDKNQNTALRKTPNISGFSLHDKVYPEDKLSDNGSAIDESSEQVENIAELGIESNDLHEVTNGSVQITLSGKNGDDLVEGYSEIMSKGRIDTSGVENIEVSAAGAVLVKTEREEELIRVKGHIAEDSAALSSGKGEFHPDGEIQVKIEQEEELGQVEGHILVDFSPSPSIHESTSESGSKSQALSRLEHSLELVSGQVVGEGASPVRVHVCEICGKPFPSKWELGRHRRTHTGERPYKCCHCNKSFSDKSNMNQHIRGVHLRQPFRKDRPYRGERLV